MTLKDKLWDRILGTTDGEPPQQLKELIAQAWDEGAAADNEYMERHCYWSEYVSDASVPEPMPPVNPYKETAKLLP